MLPSETTSREGPHDERKDTLVKPISNRIALAAAAVGLAVGIAASAAPVHAAVPPSFRCAVAKRKAAVKKLHAVDACFAKPATLTTPPDPECLAKADQKLQQEFLRIEASGGCQPETGDAGIAARLVDQFEATLVRTLPGRCVASGSPCEATAPCCNVFCVGGEIGQTPVCR